MDEWDSENLLTMLSPELSKFLNFRYYYLPNINNPVSNKYYDQFVDNAQRIGFYHAASPEEHWANYMGAKSIGRNYDKWNKSIEGIKAPEGFIDDFKNYLKNYYNKK